MQGLGSRTVHELSRTTLPKNLKPPLTEWKKNIYAKKKITFSKAFTRLFNETIIDSNWLTLNHWFTFVFSSKMLMTMCKSFKSNVYTTRLLESCSYTRLHELLLHVRSSKNSTFLKDRYECNNTFWKLLSHLPH